MIKAIILKSSDGCYKGFECEGHAGFAKRGKDIVCAAVSALTLNTYNSIEELTSSKVKSNTDNGYLSWTFTGKCDDKAALLMDSLVLGLDQIQNQYNKFLILEMKEV